MGEKARSYHYITPQRKQIEAKESVRDLQIIFEPNGKLDKHITNIAAKGTCMVGWILWIIRTCIKEAMFLLLSKLAGPQVEYRCIIWMPAS